MKSSEWFLLAVLGAITGIAVIGVALTIFFLRRRRFMEHSDVASIWQERKLLDGYS